MDSLRLYKKIDKATKSIFRQLNIDKPFHQGAFKALSLSGTLEFKSVHELKTFSQTILKKIEIDARQLDHSFFVPVLVDAISKFYTERDLNKGNVWGVAMKICLDFIWSNTYDTTAGSEKDYRLLFRLLDLAILYGSADTVIRIWDFQDIGKIELDENGYTGNELFKLAVTDLSLLGRQEYKTLSDAIDFIWFNLEEFVQIVESVIIGEIKTNTGYFEGSFLSEIPFEDQSFWDNIWSKFQIFRLAIRMLQEKQTVDLNQLNGLILLPRIHLPMPSTTRNPRELQKKVVDNFWKKDWHKSMLTKGYFELQGMIVERPVLRVFKNKEIFATSILFLQDAVNNVLERYIHLQKAGVIYEKYFSKPFEKEIVNLFRENGFKAGDVTQAGAWKNQSEQINLSSEIKMPGQIDLFAISEEQKVIIVADCKYLKFPYEKNNFRNIIDKIGDKDDEGFHCKLKRKANWIRSSSVFNKNYTLVEMLITNRFIPFNLTNENLIFSVSQIQHSFQENIRVSNWKLYWKQVLYT